MGIHLSALLGQFEAACTAADTLAEAAIARVLAEIGDDRSRFADARGLKAFAGSAPITRASGKKTVVVHRHIKNRRLAAIGPIWALRLSRSTPPLRRPPRPPTRPARGAMFAARRRAGRSEPPTVEPVIAEVDYYGG